MRHSPFQGFTLAVASGYADESILSDPRVALELALREAGMTDMMRYGLAMVEPPTAPRPDAESRIRVGEGGVTW